MCKLRSLILSAKPRKLTTVPPIVRNVTRWSSTYEMLKRYVHVRDFFSALESDGLDTSTLSCTDNRRVDASLRRIQPIESVTKSLQSDCTTLSDTRISFDAVIDKFPETSRRLSPRADIVHSPTFENAIVKLQQNNVVGLTVDERKQVSLILEQNSEYIPHDERLSFAERVLKRQKCNERFTNGTYLDTRFLLPTTNICEQLFWKVGIVLTDRRKRLNPANQELQIFLHLNRDLWDRTAVNEILVA